MFLYLGSFLSDPACSTEHENSNYLSIRMSLAVDDDNGGPCCKFGLYP